MADEKPTRAVRTVQGEVVRVDAPGHPSPVRKTLYRLISRLSTVPFFNRMSKRSLDSAREVIEAQTELGDALIKHQLGADRLTDMPTIVATARAERKAGQYEAETRLSKAKAAHEERFLDKQISQQHKDQELKRNKIADVDLDIQLQKKLKESEALNAPNCLQDSSHSLRQKTSHLQRKNATTLKNEPTASGLQKLLAVGWALYPQTVERNFVPHRFNSYCRVRQYQYTLARGCRAPQFPTAASSAFCGGWEL